MHTRQGVTSSRPTSSEGAHRVVPDPTRQHRGDDRPDPANVVAYELSSLDGVAETPDRFITSWDDETDADLASVIAAQDAVILGRRGYDAWAEFWPGSEIQSFASFINAVPKYVPTSTPLERKWANSRVIDVGLVDFVRHLKARPGGDIGVQR
jgi:dihydrofolate reductase